MTAPSSDPFEAACLSLSLLHSQGYLALLESSTALVRQRYDLVSSVPASSPADPLSFFQWKPDAAAGELILGCDPLRDVGDDSRHRSRLRYSSPDAETCRAGLPFTVGKRTGVVVVERVVEGAAASSASRSGSSSSSSPRWAYFDFFEIPIASPGLAEGWMRERGWRETIDEARAAGVADAERRARNAAAALPVNERRYWNAYDASLAETEEKDGEAKEQDSETDALGEAGEDDYWAAYEDSAALPSY
ncbi:hypothetical protein HDU86_003955 [Geranomyces michiganensis]|nr:hypothetical protein HDU86_003955 [Geranomyces michiganensis]